MLVKWKNVEWSEFWFYSIFGGKENFFFWRLCFLLFIFIVCVEIKFVKFFFYFVKCEVVVMCKRLIYFDVKIKYIKYDFL